MKPVRRALVLVLLTPAALCFGDDPQASDQVFRNVILEARKALPDARLRRISIADEGEEAGYVVEARRGDEEFHLRLDLKARIIEVIREGPISDMIRAAVSQRAPDAELIEAVRHEVRAERRLIAMKQSRRSYEVALRRGDQRAVVIISEAGELREEPEWRAVEPEDEDEDDEEGGRIGLSLEELAPLTRELSRRFPGSRLTFAHREEPFGRPVLVCGIEGEDGGRVVFFEAETRRIWRIERGLEPARLPAAVRGRSERIPEARIEGASVMEDFFKPGLVWLGKPRIVHEARIERDGRFGVIFIDARGQVIEGPLWQGEEDDEGDDE